MNWTKSYKHKNTKKNQPKIPEQKNPNHKVHKIKTTLSHEQNLSVHR